MLRWRAVAASGASNDREWSPLRLRWSAKGAVRRGVEALGRLDAASREIDGATRRLASLAAEKVVRDNPWERGRESDWSLYPKFLGTSG